MEKTDKKNRKSTKKVKTNKEWRDLLNNNLYILRADKGGKTVLWNKEEYRKEALRQLKDTDTYQELSEDQFKKSTKDIARTKT